MTTWEEFPREVVKALSPVCLIQDKFRFVPKWHDARIARLRTETFWIWSSAVPFSAHEHFLATSKGQRYNLVFALRCDFVFWVFESMKIRVNKNSKCFRVCALYSCVTPLRNSLLKAFDAWIIGIRCVLLIHNWCFCVFLTDYLLQTWS